MLVFDHLKLVERDEAEVAKIVKLMREYKRADGIVPVAVTHETFDQCCRRERWETTLYAMLALANTTIELSIDADVRGDGGVPLTASPERN